MATTKSVRLDPDETRALAELADRLGCSEAALLRRWAVAGIRETRLDLAILEFSKGRLTLEQATGAAGLERPLFEAELIRRGIVGPGVADGSATDWLRGVGRAAARLGVPALQAAVAEVLSRSSDAPAAALGVAEDTAPLVP